MAKPKKQDVILEEIEQTNVNKQDKQTNNSNKTKPNGATISEDEYNALLDKSNKAKITDDNDFKLIGENSKYYNRKPGQATLKEIERVMSGITNTNTNETTNTNESGNPEEQREAPKYKDPVDLNNITQSQLSQASNVASSLNKEQSNDLKIEYDKVIKDLNDYYGKQHTNESTYSTTILDSLRNGEFGAYDYKAEKTTKKILDNNKELTKLTDAINDKSGNKLRKLYDNEITPEEVEQEKNRISYEIFDLKEQLKSTNDKKEINKLNKEINKLDKLIKDDNSIKQGLYLKFANRDVSKLEDERKSLRTELRDNWRDPDERNARNKAGYFIANSLGTTLQNMGKSLQGKDTKSESEFSKVRGENIKSAINRRNKRFDTLLDEEIQVNHLNTEEAKEFKDIMTSIKKIIPTINQTAINEAAKIYGNLKGSQLFNNMGKNDSETIKMYMLIKLAEQSGTVGDISKLAMAMGLSDYIPDLGKPNNPVRNPIK